jgi:cephalosporin hydroxylase
MDDVECASTYSDLLKGMINVLFIDTSHLYDHTVKEIAAWFPLLNDKALVIFHDTNLDGKGYYRKDGKMEMNWNNDRGVTRAIEEYLNMPIDEKTDFEKTIQRDDIKWTLKHYSNSNGLLLLWKN